MNLHQFMTHSDGIRCDEKSANWTIAQQRSVECLDSTGVAVGLLDAARILDGLLYPSGVNAERIAYFVGRKRRAIDRLASGAIDRRWVLRIFPTQLVPRPLNSRVALWPASSHRRLESKVGVAAATV